MKKHVSFKDEKYYTYMLKLINAIGGRNLKYNWLITNIEAYPNNKKFNQMINENEFLILSNDELMDMLEEEDFQFIWGEFYAISNRYSKEEILKHKENNNFQIIAEIIICADDSSMVSIKTNDDEIINSFKKDYPKTVEANAIKKKRKLDMDVIGTIIVAAIVSIISVFFPTIGDTIIKLGFILVILYLIIMIVYLISLVVLKRFRKSKLKKVATKDLEIINEYYNLKKDWFKLFDLVFLFEDIDFVCAEFYEMKKKIHIIEGYNEQVEMINHPNREIRDYYNLAIKALDTIYKYYDKDGNRLI